MSRGAPAAGPDDEERKLSLETQRLSLAPSAVFRDISPMRGVGAAPAAFGSDAAGGFHQPVYRGVAAVHHAAPLGWAAQPASLDAAFGAPAFGAAPAKAFGAMPAYSPEKEASFKDLPPFGSSQSYAKPMPFGQQLPLHAAAKPPLALGSYLEPHYHFYSTLDGSELLKQLEQLLRASDAGGDVVDVEVFEAKFKIKCVLYSRGGSVCVPFNVRIFSLEDDDRLAVEFQRRSGDPVRFCSLYRGCLRRLQGAGVAERLADQASPVPLASPEPLAGPPDPQAAEHAALTIKCLLQMMDSDCVDVQMQAAGALADLATDAQMLEAMVEGGVVEALIHACGSSSCDVHRCALTGLAHLASSDAAARRACQLGGVQCAARLCKSGAAPHLQRECMRLIGNVVQTVGRGIYDDAGQVVEALDGLASFPPSDAGARRQWSSVQSKLQAL